MSGCSRLWHRISDTGSQWRRGAFLPVSSQTQKIFSQSTSPSLPQLRSPSLLGHSQSVCLWPRNHIWGTETIQVGLYKSPWVWGGDHLPSLSTLKSERPTKSEKVQLRNKGVWTRGKMSRVRVGFGDRGLRKTQVVDEGWVQSCYGSPRLLVCT